MIRDKERLNYKTWQEVRSMTDDQRWRYSEFLLDQDKKRYEKLKKMGCREEQ